MVKIRKKLHNFCSTPIYKIKFICYIKGVNLYIIGGENNVY